MHNLVMPGVARVQSRLCLIGDACCAVLSWKLSRSHVMNIYTSNVCMLSIGDTWSVL